MTIVFSFNFVLIEILPKYKKKKVALKAHISNDLTLTCKSKSIWTFFFSIKLGQSKNLYFGNVSPAMSV